jgi:hypothetical protein
MEEASQLWKRGRKTEDLQVVVVEDSVTVEGMEVVATVEVEVTLEEAEMMAAHQGLKTGVAGEREDMIVVPSFQVRMFCSVFCLFQCK